MSITQLDSRALANGHYSTWTTEFRPVGTAQLAARDFP